MTTIRDPVLGRHEVTEPVLVELLDTRQVRRLQGIHQAGGAYLVRDGRDTSRYEHAVGVMLLLGRFGASVAEQATGLIHDVSHTVFSHVADQLFDNRDENYHDLRFERVVRAGDIPGVLARHGIDLDAVFDESRWTMLKRPVEDLTADRLDYALRDLSHVGWISRPQVTGFLERVAGFEGQLVITEAEAAIWFAHQFHRLVTGLFMDPVEVYANRLLADVLARGLACGVLTLADLMRQDDEVLATLERSRHAEILSLLGRLKPGMVAIEDREAFEVRAYLKGRYTDPLVMLEPGRLVRCSSLDPSVAGLRDDILARARAGVFVRIA